MAHKERNVKASGIFVRFLDFVGGDRNVAKHLVMTRNMARRR